MTATTDDLTFEIGQDALVYQCPIYKHVIITDIHENKHNQVMFYRYDCKKFNDNNRVVSINQIYPVSDEGFDALIEAMNEDILMIERSIKNLEKNRT